MHSSLELDDIKTAVGDSPISELHLIQPRSKLGAASRFRRAIIVWEVVADLLTIIGSVILGYIIYNWSGLGKHVHYPFRVVIAVGVVFSFIMVLMLDRVGAYRQGSSLLRVRETEQVLRVSIEALLVIFAVSFFTNVLFSRWLLLISLSLIPLLLFIQKNLSYLFVRHLHSRGYGNEKVLIYGAGVTGRRVFSSLLRSPKLGLAPIGFVDDDSAKIGSAIHEMGYDCRRSAPVLQGPIAVEMLVSLSVDLVIIAVPSIGREQFMKAVRVALNANTRVAFVPSHLLPSDPWLDYQDMDGVLLASFGRTQYRFGYESIKRLGDILGAMTLSAIGLPLFALLAAAVKLDSSGSVIFSQERIGRNGRPFRMFKFRTMYTDSSAYGYSPKVSDDPRITRIGKLLRRTSLDELPQLFNVLRGNMSLVGPRPEMPFIVNQYSDRHRQRLQVKPGITGLWQLSGDRAFLIHENIEYDLYYIQHRNFFMDLAILFHTAFFAMRGI